MAPARDLSTTYVDVAHPTQTVLDLDDFWWKGSYLGMLDATARSAHAKEKSVANPHATRSGILESEAEVERSMSKTSLG